MGVEGELQPGTLLQRVRGQPQLERGPPQLAADWDSVGLVCGDPTEQVSSVTVAVDATAAVVADVPDGGLLLAHHPLLLRGVDTVSAGTAKGALLHRLIRAGSALFTAHTNADSAVPGVSDALAERLGLRVTRPLAPHGDGSGPTGIGRIGELPEAMPFAEFLDLLPPLRPRYYSISSSPLRSAEACSITAGVLRGPARLEVEFDKLLP